MQPVEHLKKEKGISGRKQLMTLELIIKNIRDLFRGINKFKKGYQPRINITSTKNEDGNLRADPQIVLNSLKNFFNQVLNVHGVHEVRQMDMHTAEPLVAQPSLVEV
jgi:hypothetical protein